jgi:hypothetical protein
LSPERYFSPKKFPSENQALLVSTRDIVEPIQPQTQTIELDLPTSTQVNPLCATTPATTTEILLCNVRVNAIADYYDIPQLKQLANTKIQHVLETSWSADGFSDIVKLHNIMTLTAATHIEELLEFEDFAALEVMSDFSISVIRNKITAHKAKEDLSTRKLQAVESQLQYAESRLQSTEQDCTYEKLRSNCMGHWLSGYCCGVLMQ